MSREQGAWRRERGAGSEDESREHGARRREHGSLSSECRGVKQKARRLGGPEQNSEILEGERWLVYTHARRARDVSTCRGARWAVARELPALASNTRVSDRALASNTRERAVEHSTEMRE